MIGLVLAAGAGRRLRPYTDTLPKALVPVDGETTILDIALRNLAAVGLTDIAIVVGYARRRGRGAAGRPWRRSTASRSRLVHNDKAEEWNNAYSLWLARDHFAQGALLVNGDTVHPVSVEQTLLAERGPGILLAIDTLKTLADEEMKTIFDAAGQLTRITKLMDPAEAYGEYIGATLIEPQAGRGARRRAGGDLAARPEPLLRGRLPGVRRPRRRGAGARRSARSPGSRSTTTTTWPGRGRSRAATSPYHPDPAAHRRPARGGRRPGAILADRRISAGGDVAVVVGPGQGEQIAELIRPSLRRGRRLHRRRRHPRRRRRARREAARPLVRRGRRHRRRHDHRHREVRRHPAAACRWSRWRPASPTTASPRRWPA